MGVRIPPGAPFYNMKENMTEKVVETLSPMQQELLNRADSIFETLKQGAIVAKDFAMEQLPDIAQQYILFNRVFLSFVELLPFISLLLIWLFYFLCCKEHNRRINAGEPETGAEILFNIGCGASCIAFIITFIAACVNFKDFLLVWFAPKIFLIQTITELVSKR